MPVEREKKIQKKKNRKGFRSKFYFHKNQFVKKGINEIYFSEMLRIKLILNIKQKKYSMLYTFVILILKYLTNDFIFKSFSY